MVWPRWVTLAGFAIVVGAVWAVVLGVIAGAVLGVFCIVVSTGTALIRRGLTARRIMRGSLTVATPGMGMASRFGSGALDIAQANGITRLFYDRVRGIHVDRDIVVLRYAQLFIGFPRELFPDWAIELIRAHRAASGTTGYSANIPALPPIPPIEQPDVSMVADPGTAVAMARESFRVTLRSVAILSAIFAVLCLFLGRLLSHDHGLAAGLGLAVITTVWLLASAVRGGPKTRAAYQLSMPPGEPLSARFGSEAFEVRTASARIRHPYAAMTSMRAHGPAMVVRSGGIHVYPRELFPENAITHAGMVNKLLAK